MKNITRFMFISGLTFALTAGRVFAFTDVPSTHPASAAVTEFVNLGKVAGKDNFFPEQNITRCEFLKMLVSPLPVDAKVDIVKVSYTDVREDSWCGIYVKYALLTGVLKTNNGAFRPDDPIILADAVRLIYRHYSGFPLVNMLVSVKNFTDVNARDTTLPLYEIEQGIIDGVIVPKFLRRLGLYDPLTRGEAVRMLHEAYNDYEYTRADADKVLFGNADARTRLAVLGVLNSMANDYFHRDKLNYDEMLRSAIKAFTQKANDPLLQYYLSDEFKQFLSESGGTYVGMGVQLSLEGGRVSIARIFPETPAERAGLRAGDAIVSVNGQEVTTATLEAFFSLFTRAAGEKVTLGVVRAGEAERLTFTMTLTAFNIPEVESALLDHGVAHIAISAFGSGTSSQLTNVLRGFKTSPVGIVLDLRDNPGGDLDGAVAVSSAFLRRGTIVAKLVDNRDRQEVLRTVRAPIRANAPMVVLVNDGTASAAEILTLALREHVGAKVIGAKTVGKGTVQRVYSYPDGSGFKQTVYHWLSGKSVSIHGVGIMPDRVVTDDPFTSMDDVLQAGLEELRQAAGVP